MSDTQRVDDVMTDLREVLLSLTTLRRHLALEVLRELSTQVDALQSELDDAADEVLRGD